MRKIYMMLLAAIIVMPVFADDKLRVDVFDPTSSGTTIDEGTKVAIREIISSTIVNAGDYDIVERSLLEKVIQEQSSSHSGAVDDSDATVIAASVDIQEEQGIKPTPRKKEQKMIK